MMQTDAPQAIPLWISGHAYLTLAPEFLDVRNPASGQVLRRTPLCGAAEARQAIAAAQAALGPWSARAPAARADLLAALGDSLASYAAHFALLIADETGLDAAQAAAEVADAVALLRAPASDALTEVVAVVGDRRAPLLSALRLAVPALLAGATVVVRPAPQTPSALFAWAELTGRCAFPPGVVNLVHGADAVVAALHAGGARVLGAAPQSK